MVLITIVTGANLNQLITGGPHIVEANYFLRGKANAWSHTRLPFHKLA